MTESDAEVADKIVALIVAKYTAPCCKAFRKFGFCPYTKGVSRKTGKPIR